MRITVHAVGRMKTGPERELAARYFDRFAKAGNPLGLVFQPLIETVESRAQSAELRNRDEAARVLALKDAGAHIVLLDEGGKSPNSREFAETIAQIRDSGARDLVFAIGGPDGHDAHLVSRADSLLSFGRMTWPHQIARILLAEQLYRAVTILSGHPYHRD